MITFAYPKKQKMAIACESIELTGAGNWDSFPDFAEKYAEQIGAKIVTRISTPDMHIWQIEYEGHALNFVYNDFPNGVSLEPNSETGKDAIEKLWKIIEKQSEPNGL